MAASPARAVALALALALALTLTLARDATGAFLARRAWGSAGCDSSASQPTLVYLATERCAYSPSLELYIEVSCEPGAGSYTVRGCLDSECTNCPRTESGALPGACVSSVDVFGAGTSYTMADSCMLSVPYDSDSVFAMAYEGGACSGALVSMTNLSCVQNSHGVFATACNSRGELRLVHGCAVGCAGSCSAAAATSLETGCRVDSAQGPDGQPTSLATRNQCTNTISAGGVTRPLFWAIVAMCLSAVTLANV